MKEQSSDGREIASKILKKVASIFRLPYDSSQEGFKVFNTDAMSSFNIAYTYMYISTHK